MSITLVLDQLLHLIWTPQHCVIKVLNDLVMIACCFDSCRGITVLQLLIITRYVFVFHVYHFNLWVQIDVLTVEVFILVNWLISV